MSPAPRDRRTAIAASSLLVASLAAAGVTDGASSYRLVAPASNGDAAYARKLGC